MTRDEAFEAYQETLSKIAEQSSKAMEEAKAILHERLKPLSNAAHEELKAIRTITQKTKSIRG